MHPIYRLDDEGNIKIRPIGHVRSEVQQQQTGGFAGLDSDVELDPQFEPLLLGLDDFSHVVVVYWLSEIGSYSEQRHPQGRDDVPLVGILASRCPDRPNPVGLATVRLLSRDGTRLRVRGLDAIDGTPVLDVKPWYPQYDRPDDPIRAPDYVFRLAY